MAQETLRVETRERVGTPENLEALRAFFARRAAR